MNSQLRKDISAVGIDRFSINAQVISNFFGALVITKKPQDFLFSGSENQCGSGLACCLQLDDLNFLAVIKRRHQ